MTQPSVRSEPYKTKPRTWPKIKTGARHALDRLGAPGALLLSGWRTAGWVAQVMWWKCMTVLSPTVRSIVKLGIDIDRVCWVDPATIKLCSNREFAFQDFKGRIVDGDWDLSTKHFEDLDVYVAMKQVCIQGMDWKNTHFYRNFLDCVNAGEPLWGCRNEQEVDERLRYLQSLFELIKREGYKSQEELRRTGRTVLRAGEGEVTVCIGRDGNVLFSDGAHRLVTAKLLGIPKIPVQVSVRHPEWIAFREELLAHAQGIGGKLRQPALHPDLDNIPALNGCDDRFQAIRQHMSARSGRLLDIGAKLGYFCHRFEEEGFACHAAEDAPGELYFLRKLRTMARKKFDVLDESAVVCRKIRETRFDVVLALNSLRPYLNTRASYELLVDMLRNLHTDELYFEPHSPAEPSMREAYKNLGPEDFVLLVQSHTGLKLRQLIREYPDGGRLYRLSRDAHAAGTGSEVIGAA